MKIPFVDLKIQYRNYKTEIDAAIANVISDAAFIGGGGNKYIMKFENEFAHYLGIKHCVSCGNGTDSLEILLRAFSIGQGDEVLVPALTWIATSEAVSSMGAKPIFIDVDPDYYTIDPVQIRKKITKKTKAIIPVHLYGLPAEMDEIMAIAKEYNLIVIEDCAQAHGAEYKGKKVGTIGHAGSFSFYPGKNLGAYGDAGCMVTNNAKIAEKARMIANHGQLHRHDHQMEGRNSRMDGMQAAILLAKLPHLNEWIEARINNAKIYNQQLSSISGLILPQVPPYAKHVFHLYVIQIADRDRIKTKLTEHGIGFGIHYPKPLPLLKAYRHFHHKLADSPIASKITRRILSLPMYPELTLDQIQFISKVIKHS